MSVSSFDNVESPIRPLDFASLLLSPEVVDAIRKAYTPPPTPAVFATAHNRNIIQEALRLQTPTYIIPAHLFNTPKEQQLWRDSIIQSHAPGMPVIKGRIPMSAFQTWIEPAPVLSATSTALDWSTTAMQDWFLYYPVSQRPVPSIDIYYHSLRLDLAAQPHPIFQHAVLNDTMVF